MPRYQDPGHYGQHAFTAFIHSYFAFCSLQTSTHFDPAQYLKHSHSDREIAAEVAWVDNEADEVEVVVVTATMPGCMIGCRGWLGPVG